MFQVNMCVLQSIHKHFSYFVMFQPQVIMYLDGILYERPKIVHSYKEEGNIFAQNQKTTNRCESVKVICIRSPLH